MKKKKLYKPKATIITEHELKLIGNLKGEVIEGIVTYKYHPDYNEYILETVTPLTQEETRIALTQIKRLNNKNQRRKK